MAIVAGVVSTLVGAYVALFRHAIAQRDREIDRRLEEIIRQLNALDGMARGASTGAATFGTRLDGMAGDVSKIKETYVTREVLTLQLASVSEIAKSALALVRSVPTSGASYRAHGGLRDPRVEPTTNPPPRRTGR